MIATDHLDGWSLAVYTVRSEEAILTQRHKGGRDVKE